MMECSICDRPLGGRGTRMCHFDTDYGTEKIIEYYCSSACIKAAWE